MGLDRVLVAAIPSVSARIASMLPDCGLLFVNSLDGLLQALDAGPWDLLLVGSHFDESQPLAALRQVLERHPPFPVVFVRATSFAPALERVRVPA